MSAPSTFKMPSKYEAFTVTTHKGQAYTTILGIFLIELLLSSVLYSYGIFYAEFVQLDIFSWQDALWTPVIFEATRNIANPWTRFLVEHFEDVGFDSQRVTFWLAPHFITFGVAIASSTNSALCQSIAYGFLGGLSVSLVLSQTFQSTYEDFQAKPLVYEATTETAKAISLMIAPHFVSNMLIKSDVHQVQLIFGSILLHVIPIGLLFKRKRKPTNEASLSRFKTFQSLYSDNIELPTITRMTVSNPQYDSDSSSNSSPEEKCVLNDDNAEQEKCVSKAAQDKGEINHVMTEQVELKIDEVIYQNPEVKEPNILEESDNPKPNYQRMFSFEILPEIPEEDETQEEPKTSVDQFFQSDLKRLSKISNRLEDLIVVDDNHNPQPQFLQSFNSIQENVEYNQYSYQNYKQSSLACGEFCGNNMWKPLRRSLKKFQFYPSLFAKTTDLFVSTVFFAMVPHVSMVEGLKDYKNITLNDATFLLTVAAFAWLFFLVTLPKIVNMSKSKVKIVFIVGLAFACCGMALLTRHLSHDIITLSCLFYGLAHGIISFTQEITFREAIGLRHWKEVQGTLETTSGILLLVIYIIIYNSRISIGEMLSEFYIFYVLNFSFWLFWTVFKLAANFRQRIA